MRTNLQKLEAVVRTYQYEEERKRNRRNVLVVSSSAGLSVRDIKELAANKGYSDVIVQ